MNSGWNYACLVVLAVFIACVTPSLSIAGDGPPPAPAAMQPTPLVPPDPLPGQKQKPVKPEVEPPDAPHYTCPPGRYIDCMPPVRESARKWCTPEYIQWVKGHCPGVEVVY